MAEGNANTGSRLILYIAMTVMLIAGAGNTIFLKLQIEVKSEDGNKYTHPYFGALNVFLGGAMANIMYIVYRIKTVRTYGSLKNSPDWQSALSQGKKLYIHWAWLAIPAFFDFIAIPLMNLGLILISASVYQMMRGGLIFLIAISSILFLRARLHRHHWTSLVFIISGITLVGLSSIIHTSSESSNAVLGISLLLSSQVFSTAHWIIEEKYLQTHYIHPFKMVGLEGLWNLFFSAIMVVIAQYIKCDGSYWTNGRLEDTPYALRQMRENPIIIVYFVLLVFCIWTFQVSGVFTTKYGSSAQRCTIDIARIILIWAFFLVYSGEGHEKFDLIEFIGFIGIVIGTIVYNEIYVPPLFNFNKNTKTNISKRNKEEEGSRLLEEDNEITEEFGKIEVNDSSNMISDLSATTSSKIK